jgi:hypothetical protein
MAWFNRILTNRTFVPDSFLNAVSKNREDTGRVALRNFVKENRDLQSAVLQRFDKANGSSVTRKDKLVVATFLTKYGMAVAEKGDYLRAASALLFALLVFPDFLEAVASMAIVYHAWEDRIAAKWAEHFQTLTAPEKAAHSYLTSGFLSSGVMSSERTELLRKQMVGIVFDCEQHPEWRDSSTGRQKFGMAH